LERFGPVTRAWVTYTGRAGFVEFLEEKDAHVAVATKNVQVNEIMRMTVVWPNKNHGPPTLYCDLDGVLCDFVLKATEILGKSPNAIRDRKDPEEISWMWEKLRTSDGFYSGLPWMPQGKALWNSIKHLKPVILTGCPRGEWAAIQKATWVKNNLGGDVKIITCFAPKKPKYCKFSDVIIDDSENLGSHWRSRGGFYVLHNDLKIDKTFTDLRNLGVIAPKKVPHVPHDQTGVEQKTYVLEEDNGKLIGGTKRPRDRNQL